jgi:hypothetical protein
LLVAIQGLEGQQATTYPELDRMHDEAMALAYTSRPGDLERAAWRHGHVAILRPEDDMERFKCLRIQAELLMAAGYPEGARFHLEEAARQAENAGHAYSAAMAYIDAAILAVEAGDTREARALGVLAYELSSSPRLATAQRSEIRQRLQPAR